MTFGEYKIYIQKHYPKYKDVGYFFHQLTDKYIKRGDRLLNAGCGSQGYRPDYLDKVNLAVGVDRNPEILETNHQLKNLIVTNLVKLPFSDSVFDVIICEWLFEHLREPGKVMKEFSRVLKNRGRLILMTPNLNNPFIFLSYLLPTFIHKFGRIIGD
ncbi:class I SAM-dependent methyltransferase [bacterium]|nr:class I SAM-dependent methyltransferase [bacterium]